MKKYALVSVVVLVSFFGFAHSTVWYVHPDSTMNCIQDCLDSCATGDTVLAGPGTYIENIMWPVTGGICLISEYGPDTTIIDGDSSGAVITIASTADTTTAISGFTVTNGYHTNVGGIYCGNASPRIEGNIIIENTGIWGGGIACWYSDAAPLIINNIVRNNHSDSTGGGIVAFSYAHPMILDNVIDSNTSYWGGGIYCHTGSSPVIRGNDIVSNIAILNAAGIGCYYNSSTIIEDNFISGNVAGYHGGGILCYSYSSPIIKHNVINSNTAANYAGMRLTEHSSPQIDSCTIAYNNYDGICCWGGSNPVIYHCNVYGHSMNGVWNLDANLTIQAENLWWGDSTGPWHVTQNPGGLGNGVSDFVDFIPWLQDSVDWQTGIANNNITQPKIIMLQVHPNPFSHSTKIRYSILDTRLSITKSNISIYEATGRLVKSLNLESSINNQESEVVWDGTDDLNRRLASGVYFVVFSADRHSETRKVLKIR